MNLQQILSQLDAPTVRAFVSATRDVVDALLIEGQRIRETQSPSSRDYSNAELPNDAPAGGWLSRDEVRAATQRMTEAIALEKWTDGALFAVRAMMLIGGGL